MNNLPFSLVIIIVCVFIAAVEIISKKSKRLNIGKYTILGIVLTLMPLAVALETIGDFTSITFIIGLPMAFAGIIILILDKN